jgi:deazaflavin-dependent oxidoreductase (nitroreductase family)
MSPLDRPPPTLVKLLARLPLILYRLRLGRLLCHRFLVITHRGRRTGRSYHTVVEVVKWDGERQEATVASGWGEHANWYRNLRANPAVNVTIAGQRFVPVQRFLPVQERIAVLQEYRRRHPLTARVLTRLLGIATSDESEEEAATSLPMVAFRVPPSGGSA